MRPSVGVLMGLFATVLGFFGCSTRLRGGEIASGDSSTPGLRYHVPKDVLLVTGEITRRAVRGVFDDPNSIQLGGYEETTTGQVEPKAVPDQTRTFVLHMEPGGTADNTLDVTLKGSGLASKVNVISADKSAEIVANTVKFAARIAATTAGVPPIGIGVAPPSLKELLAALEGPGVLKVLYDRWFEASQKYDIFLTEVRDAEKELRDAKSDDDKVKKAKEHLTVAEASTMRFDTLRTKARTELLTEYEAFKARQRLGAVEDKRPFSYMVTLAEAKAAGGESIASSGIEGVASKIRNQPTLKALWDDVGVVVTATPVGGIASPVDEQRKYSHDATGDRTKTPIFYRSARPMLISVWVKDVLLDEAATSPSTQAAQRKPTLRLASHTILDVRDPDDPARHVAFDEKAFSTQNVEIGFDDRGNLITFKRTGTSSVAAFTKALADAVESLPKEYQAGVTALGGAAVESDKQAAAVADQRKKTLEAEAARLDAEIKLLEAQKKYREALEAAKKAGQAPAPPPTQAPQL